MEEADLEKKPRSLGIFEPGKIQSQRWQMLLQTILHQDTPAKLDPQFKYRDIYKCAKENINMIITNLHLSRW